LFIICQALNIKIIDTNALNEIEVHEKIKSKIVKIIERVSFLKNFAFHPQPPESGLLDSRVRHLNLEDRKFKITDLLSVPFGEWRKPRGFKLNFCYKSYTFQMPSKKIFGEEASKPLLMEFLNCLLPENNTIKNLSFKSTEQLGQTEADRKAIYDIYCESTTGEKFIVELQKAKQNYFIDRTIYYSTFPIREQAQKGEWDYNLKAVFCIGILDFAFDEPKTKEPTVIHRVKLKNQENNVFYDKLTYIYLEMPHFNKQEKECKTKLEKFLYFLKHLEDFENIPEIFKGEILFEKAFERAEIAKFNQAELHNYEMSLKVFRDLKNTMDYAVEEALKEGIEKGIEKALKKMIESGMAEEQAKKILGI